jgi:hypothetical protein
MKTISLKSGLLTSLIMAAAAHSGAASAHSYSGSLSNGALLGVGAGATDTFAISCFLDPGEPSQNPADHLYLDINSQTAGGLMSAQAVLYNYPSGSGNLTAVTTTDDINANGQPSTGRSLKVNPPTQNVTFFVTVSHTKNIAQNYTIDYHCQDANGVHVGTTDNLTPLQNQ